ncbi:MAG TPA: hypothetical protein VFS89_03695 [Nitrosospira sp.]|nr:hypothetical protein [Nitrosospira sp.]
MKLKLDKHDWHFIKVFAVGLCVTLVILLAAVIFQEFSLVMYLIAMAYWILAAVWFLLYGVYEGVKYYLDRRKNKNSMVA